MVDNENAVNATAEAAPSQAGGEAGEANNNAETMPAETTDDAAAAAAPEDISYHAVEKDGQVTAIWEMQGRKHHRTIDPRSRQGQEILRLYTAEHEHQ
ncbi:MAG: hypothetical protein ACR2G4_11740 [Pyrinomonadaceae bacterium]